MQIPIMKPTFDAEEEAAAVAVLRSGWVTQGPAVAEFEAMVADHVGAEHGVAVTSATSALFAALVSMEIGPGDEVICPSHSYIATANSIIHAGATPVLVDIDGLTHAIDPIAVEAAITSRTRAIMPVHSGMAADIDAIYDIARRHDLLVIEDAAPAIGARYKDRMIGNSDGPVVFSFHPRKIITTGEGGMVMTNDAALADRLRLLRHHYMSLSDTARHNATDVVFESYEEVGWNLRMTDLQAGVGIAQMAKLDRILCERRRVASNYDSALGHNEFLATPFVPSHNTHTYQSYIVRVSENAPIGRSDLMKRLLDRGISTRRGIMNAHVEPAYRKRFGELSLPVSEAVSNSTLILPVYVGMTEAEQAYVIDAIDDAFAS